MIGCQHALRRSPRIAAIQGKTKEENTQSVDMEIDGAEQEDNHSVVSDKSFMTDFTIIDNNDIHSS